MSKIAALSFWQPYAWLIVNGHADVDSRLWAPPEKRFGERIAVHASKRKVTIAEFNEFLEMAKSCKIKDHPQSRDEFEYGAVIGSVVIAGVTKNSKSYWAAPGYFHWKLESPKKHAPVPLKGQRGWFSIQAVKRKQKRRTENGEQY